MSPGCHPDAVRIFFNKNKTLPRMDRDRVTDARFERGGEPTIAKTNRGLADVWSVGKFLATVRADHDIRMIMQIGMIDTLLEAAVLIFRSRFCGKSSRWM